MTISPLLADIIREVLAGHVAIEIVAQITRRNRLEQRLRALQPGLVLIGLRRGESDAIAQSILTALPYAIVIAFSNDARRAYLHQMRPQRTELHDVSKETLIALLNAPS